MAENILSRYGIKEVADVMFYEIDETTGKPAAPVLYLDSLKVSTIEQTAENTSARGGKGNPELITWDYNKEITLTLEDALFSAKSMAIMYGITITDETGNYTGDFKETTSLLRTARKADITWEGADGSKQAFIHVLDEKVELKNPKFYDEKGQAVTADAGKEPTNDYVFATGEIDVQGREIVISANKFPGTYYVTGDTYARSEVSGKDEAFQFIVPKAKMQSEVTLTMEAEGDPATFNMNMKVLRPADGNMMKLVKYSVTGAEG